MKDVKKKNSTNIYPKGIETNYLPSNELKMRKVDKADFFSIMEEISSMINVQESDYQWVESVYVYKELEMVKIETISMKRKADMQKILQAESQWMFELV